MDKDKYSKYHDGNINYYIYNKILKNKKILDVGCNTSDLGERLIKLKDCEVWGIDYSMRAIDISKKKIKKAKYFDMETCEIPFSGEKFDIIIFGDVLEHIKSPEIILQNYTSILNNKGLIIASIPNVANIHVRINLLFGKWKYKSSGILDKTHVKFFTRKSVMELFNLNGLKVINMDYTPGFDFYFLKYFKILKKVKYYMCKIYPKLFARQFIIVAKKNGT